MPPRPDPNEERYRHYFIDWNVVMEAAEGTDEARKRLAIMLWPTDDCSRFAKEIPCEPKAPVLDSEGKPKKTGGRTWMSYSTPKSCRFCSVWAVNPRNRVNTSNWPPAFKTGAHHPRECSRSILALLQTSEGATFLRENRNRSKSQ